MQIAMSLLSSWTGDELTVPRCWLTMDPTQAVSLAQLQHRSSLLIIRYRHIYHRHPRGDRVFNRCSSHRPRRHRRMISHPHFTGNRGFTRCSSPSLYQHIGDSSGIGGAHVRIRENSKTVLAWPEPEGFLYLDSYWDRSERCAAVDRSFINDNTTTRRGSGRFFYLYFILGFSGVLVLSFCKEWVCIKGNHNRQITRHIEATINFDGTLTNSFTVYIILAFFGLSELCRELLCVRGKGQPISRLHAHPANETIQLHAHHVFRSVYHTRGLSAFQASRRVIVSPRTNSTGRLASEIATDFLLLNNLYISQILQTPE